MSTNAIPEFKIPLSVKILFSLATLMLMMAIASLFGFAPPEVQKLHEPMADIVINTVVPALSLGGIFMLCGLAILGVRTGKLEVSSVMAATFGLGAVIHQFFWWWGLISTGLISGIESPVPVWLIAVVYALFVFWCIWKIASDWARMTLNRIVFVAGWIPFCLSTMILVFSTILMLDAAAKKLSDHRQTVLEAPAASTMPASTTTQ